MRPKTQPLLSVYSQAQQAFLSRSLVPRSICTKVLWPRQEGKGKEHDHRTQWQQQHFPFFETLGFSFACCSIETINNWCKIAPIMSSYHLLHLGGIEHEVDEFQAFLHPPNASLSPISSWLVTQFLCTLWQYQDATWPRNQCAGRTLCSHIFVLAQGLKNPFSIYAHSRII